MLHYCGAADRNPIQYAGSPGSNAQRRNGTHSGATFQWGNKSANAGQLWHSAVKYVSGRYLCANVGKCHHACLRTIPNPGRPWPYRRGKGRSAEGRKETCRGNLCTVTGRYFPAANEQQRGDYNISVCGKNHRGDRGLHPGGGYFGYICRYGKAG